MMMSWNIISESQSWKLLKLPMFFYGGRWLPRNIQTFPVWQGIIWLFLVLIYFGVIRASTYFQQQPIFWQIIGNQCLRLLFKPFNVWNRGYKPNIWYLGVNFYEDLNQIFEIKIWIWILRSNIWFGCESYLTRTRS